MAAYTIAQEQEWDGPDSIITTARYVSIYNDI